MIETQSLKDLAIVTVKDPQTAARQLIAMDLDRGTLWLALFLMAVLNTLLHGLSNLLVQGPSPIPAVFDSPAVYFFFVAGGLVLIVVTLFWAGRAFGGEARMEDIMVIIAWLQFMRVLVQIVALILLVTIPVLSAVLVLAAAIIGLWILVHFVNQAHQFDSLGKSVGVLIVAFIGMVLGVSVLLSLIGVGAVGGGYV